MNYVMPPESTVQPMDNHYWQQEVYVTAANLFAFTPWWTANLSADFQWNKLDADGTDMFNAHFIEPRRYTLLGAIATSVNLKCRQACFTHMYMTGALGGWKPRLIKTYSLPR